MFVLQPKLRQRSSLTSPHFDFTIWICQTQIAYKVRLHISWIGLKNVIYFKYETSTPTPFVKPRDVLNLAVQNVFYMQSFVESAFTYNPGLTFEFLRTFSRSVLDVENGTNARRGQKQRY